MSDMFDGKTGRELTIAVIDAGHDAILTVDGNELSESLDLTEFDPDF